MESTSELLDRIKRQGRITGFSSDWQDDVIHYLNGPGGGSSSSGQGTDDAGGGGPSSSGQGADDDGGGSQSSEPQDRDDSPPDPPSRYRYDDDDGYSRRRTVSPPAVEPEPLPSAFATGEEGYAPEAIGALDTEEWVGALGDGEERVSLQGMEDERRAFLAQERDSERQQASKEQQEGAGRRDHLYDALWYSESTDELTEEQLELLYAQLSGLRETGISGDELYQAIGQSEVVTGMNEEQRDTLLRDVGAAQSSSSAAQDVEVGSFGTGSEIGPYVPEPGDLLDRSRRDIERAVDVTGDELGWSPPETELEQLKAQGGGIWRRDPDSGDMARVPDEEVARWMERPHVPEPGDLLDRSGRDIERAVDVTGDELGWSPPETELDRLKAQGGGIWRRDPDSGDMARVPDEEVERWMERPHVPEPGDLLDRSGRDIERAVDVTGDELGWSPPETELDRLKAQGGGIWRRDPDSGDMARVPDEEVERWMERPHVPEPGDLLDRGSGRDIERAVDVTGDELGWSPRETELDRLKAQGGGIWRRDPDSGDMRECPTKR